MTRHAPDTLSLVADVGGTNTRVALAEGERLLKDTVKKYANKDYPGLGGVLSAFIEAEDVDCLGAAVARHRHREIGWFRLEATETRHWLNTTLPETFQALHWHGDRFEIPDGAHHLFRSKACDNQAFAVGDQIIGLQFHLEFDMDTANRVGEACADELTEGGEWVQPLSEITARKSRFQAANELMALLLDKLFKD